MQHTPKTPHIRFLVILPIFPNLRRHHEGRADFGLGEVEGLIHEFGDAEIANLHLIGRCDENVVSLEIAVQDLLVVDVLEPEGELDEPLEHLCLAKRPPLCPTPF